MRKSGCEMPTWTGANVHSKAGLCLAKNVPRATGLGTIPCAVYTWTCLTLGCRISKWTAFVDYNIVLYSMNVDSRCLDGNAPTPLDGHHIYEPYLGKSTDLRTHFPTWMFRRSSWIILSSQSYGYTICRKLGENPKSKLQGSHGILSRERDTLISVLRPNWD